MCHLCNIVLEPVLIVTQKSDDVYPLGMIMKRKNFEFGGGWAGDEDAGGIRYKNLCNDCCLKIKINCIDNIKIFIYIINDNGKTSKYEIKNKTNKIYRQKLHKNDNIFFGYIYNIDNPPVYDFRVLIKKKK